MQSVRIKENISISKKVQKVTKDLGENLHCLLQYALYTHFLFNFKKPTQKRDVSNL